MVQSLAAGPVRTGRLKAQKRNTFLHKAAYHKSLLRGRERVGLLTCMSPSLAAAMPAADMVAAAAQHSSASSRAHGAPLTNARSDLATKSSGSPACTTPSPQYEDTDTAVNTKKMLAVFTDKTSAPSLCTELPLARC